MNVIKVNYNNLYVRKPKSIHPFFFCYKKLGFNGETNKVIIVIQNMMFSEPYFNNFVFTVRINEDIIKYIDLNSNNKIIVEDENYSSIKGLYVSISGFYTKDGKHKYEFNPIISEVKTFPYCSDYTLCSEDLFVGQFEEGYLIDNKFYLTKVSDTIYTDEVEYDENIYYYDINYNKIYTYDGTNFHEYQQA